MQEQLIRQHTKGDTRIVLMFDEDEAGRAARAEIVQQLAINRFVKVVPLPEEGCQPEHLAGGQLAQLIVD